MGKTEGRNAVIEERSLDSRGIQILAAAIILAVAVYAVVGTLYVQFAARELPEGMTPFAKNILDIGLLLFTVLCAGTSFIVRRQMNRALPTNAAGRLVVKLRAVIMGMAIAEAGALAALMYALMLQDLSVAYVAWGIALAATILHFPTRAWLNEPGPQAQSSE
jgi:hypothetical protein